MTIMHSREEDIEDALNEAIAILKVALKEHEETWGPVESFTGDEDWSIRATALIAKHEGKH